MSKIMINGTDFSTPLVMNEAERITYGDSNIKVSLDKLNNMIRVATYNATFDSSNGLYRLNLNKSNVLVISAKMIGNAVQVDLYENTSGDYF